MRTPEQRQKWIYAMVLVVACTFLILFLRYNERGIVEQTAVHFGISGETVLARTNIQKYGLRGQNPIERSISNDLQTVTAARERSRDQWRTPIEFYGKVVDTNNEPIEGVDIFFSSNDLSREGVSSYRTKSDSGGLFSIIGIQGKVLLVDVSKDGYYGVSQVPNAFFFAGSNEIFTPDISNPVVFQLRQKGKAESLIQLIYPEGMKIAKLKPDGTPTTVNLFGQSPDSQSDGKVTLAFFRAQAPEDRNFTYELRLTISGGGLIETDDKLLFDAPAHGYRSTVQLIVPEDSQNWGLSLERKFYIKLSSGNFGWLDVFLYAHNGVFTIRSAVNPNGSRNLEGVGTLRSKVAQ